MKAVIFWHRRDLRISDNAGLYQAMQSGYPVLPLFIFDRHILDKLQDKSDQRVSFIHHYVSDLKERYEAAGSSLMVVYGYPEEVFPKILAERDITAVYTNHDYEPYATKRDSQLAEYLHAEGIQFHTFKDHCIFEREEIQKNDGGPYTVFTPYSKKWKAKLNPQETDTYFKPYTSDQHKDKLLETEALACPTLEEMGFKPTKKPFPPKEIRENTVSTYDKTRNFPAIDGTTRIGVHLRFGTLSIRHAVRKALETNETYLNELIWRDFYMMILANFSHVADSNFNSKYDAVKWRNNEEDFQKWCDGNTGYPIVDAGMRELNETGYMHNRLRMITASFLTKHLLIDWKWGEAYFAEKLLDYELSSNNGGWQWAAGTGTDAQPYFRVFNPYSQTEKFDKDLQYIKKWVPEFQSFSYPKPMIEHKEGRERALATYKEALGKN